MGIAAEKAKGMAKEAVGRVTHDRRLQRQGKNDQLRAAVIDRARYSVDTVKVTARHAVDATKRKSR